jgi:hypothetical protein
MRLSSKKIAAVIILAGVLLLALAGSALAAPPWSDASDAYWAGYNTSDLQVTSAKVATVADGYPDGTFKPANPVTRGQFAKMAVSGLDLATSDPATATFTDVAKGSTFFVYVEGAYVEGLIAGYASGSTLQFRPSNNISRQQTNSILARYLSQAEFESTGVIHGTGTLTYSAGTAAASLQLWYQAQGSFYLNGFLDAASVAPDHRATTAYLVFHGIVQGSNGRLNPLSTLTRAQAAVMVLRVAGEAAKITTPPPAPTALAVTPASPGKDSTPQVTGSTIPGGIVHVYDTFNGQTKDLFEGVSDALSPHADMTGSFVANITTSLVDGSHSFTAKVKNAAGLVSAASAAVPYVLDTVLPTGSITAPAVPAGEDDAAVNLAKPVFTVSATDDRSGVKNVVFQVAVDQTTLTWQTVSTDATPETGTTTYAAVWPATGDLGNGLDDGQYKFRAIISDNAGNEKTLEPVDVTVDTKAPTVEITAPVASGIYYTENHFEPFFADPTDAPKTAGIDASGVSKVEFFYVAWSDTLPTTFAGFTLLSTDVAPAYGATYPVAGLPNGHYLLAVRATDRAGNVSLLMSGSPASYVAGVTQEMIVDDAPPAVTITHPTAGQLVPDDSTFDITWTLTDTTPPDNIKIEVSDDNGDNWDVLAAATPNDGTYPWAVPDLGADDTGYKIRITATDKAGAELGDVAGHTTVATSDAFTVYDKPVAVTGLTASDPDTTNAGVDGRDFTADWTVSASAHIASQKVYVLPDGVDLVLTGGGAHVAKATFSNNTTDAWTGVAGMTTDSAGDALVGGDDYVVWIVVTDPAGRTASASSDAVTLTDP